MRKKEPRESHRRDYLVMLETCGFIALALLFLYIGRKAGWALSRGLYASHIATFIGLNFFWSIAAAGVMRALLNWQQPSALLQWVMGYALGAYVSIPNVRLFEEPRILKYGTSRYRYISLFSLSSYVLATILLALVFPYAHR